MSSILLKQSGILLNLISGSGRGPGVGAKLLVQHGVKSLWLFAFQLRLEGSR